MFNNGSNIQKYLTYTLTSIGLFAILFIANANKQRFVYTSLNAKKVEKVLAKKEKILQDVTTEYTQLITKTKIDELFTKSDSLFKILNDNNLAILIYKNDSLVFWSNKDLTSEKSFNKTYYGNWSLKSYNAFVVSRLTNIGAYKIVGLIPIKKIFPFKNNYLESSFYKEFNIPSNYFISLDDNSNLIRIKNINNEYAFSLEKRFDKFPQWLYYFYLLIFVISISFLIIGYNGFLKHFIKSKSWIFISGIFYILLRIALIEFKFPSFLFDTDLFSPFYYAQSRFLPSLGDLLISSFFILHFTYILNNNLSFKIKNENKIGISTIVMALIILYIAFYTGIIYLIKSAINNSNIPIELYDFANLNSNTFIVFLAIVALLFSFIIITKTVTTLLSKLISFKKTLVFFILIASFQLTLTDLIWFEYNIESIVFIGLLFLVLSFSNYKKHTHNQTIVLIIILIASLFTGTYTTRLNIEKEMKIRKLYAIGISSERDYEAEMQFPKLEKELSNDTVLYKLVLNPIINTERIYQQIIKNYFHGYWSKYEPNITICGTHNEFEEENQLINCNYYFNKTFAEYGVSLENTKFKFLDDLNGKISYLGALEYTLPDDSTLVTVFIELDSKLKSEKLGYPQLLLASQDNDKLFHESYSYAKYKNTKLVLQHGKHQYNLNIDDLTDNNKEFFVFEKDNYSHLVYNNGNNTFIVSLSVISFLDYLAIYSYLFVFFFILYSIGSVYSNKSLRINLFNYNLQSKIQYSMIGILLLSLLTIGIGTIVLNINKTEKAYTDEIGEKTQSILVELQHKFGNSDKLTTNDKAYLKYLFEKWSYVFFTDINLYSTSGDLITSSRMDIFNKNLTGRKMDRDAYIKMKIESKSEFIHNEKIGKLTYMSAYVPFLNNQNQVLAYINLPYFTKQKKISNETSELIVTLLNIYVLLFIITIFVAVIVAQNITKPLFLLQNHIGKIDLLKKINPIQYTRNDEIGALVDEYNKVIAELEKSANLLAKSERESAWREMAKQIAHEIKNPLTPMKLNIQFLQKSWNDKDNDFEDKLKRISGSIIEQIDSLSNIASDFSDFAHMPKSNKEEINLFVKIQNVVLLFEQTHNLKINLNNNCSNNLPIIADKEQVVQVFNNLIKNAIQSVGNDKQTEISIDILENSDNYIVKITDNGKGIPNEIQDKLFKPNFTTKSSGMGLGLAIVKNIIETNKGKVYFQTQVDIGTSFFVEFPKV